MLTQQNTGNICNSFSMRLWTTAITCLEGIILQQRWASSSSDTAWLLEAQNALSDAPEKGNSMLDSLRLTASHFPKHIPTRAKHKKSPLRRCRVCAAHVDETSKKMRRETRYCEGCNVPLCSMPCFEIYHTVYNYYIEVIFTEVKFPDSVHGLFSCL